MTSIPANLFPDLLTTDGGGWVGPVEARLTGNDGDPDDWCDAAVTGPAESRNSDARFYVCVEGEAWARKSQNLRLPLDRPEPRMHLAVVMGRGLKCAMCGGDGNSRDPRLSCSDCPDCKGTGYLRPPHDVRYLLPVAELGSLPMDLAHHSGRLLAESAVRVSGGGVVIVGVLGAWAQWSGYRWARHHIGDDRTRRPMLGIEYGTESPGRWHAFAKSPPHPYTYGEEKTADLGKAAADRAALAAGFALLQSDGSLTTGAEREA